MSYDKSIDRNRRSAKEWAPIKVVKTVWKFPFDIQDFFVLTMPVDAELLTLQMQGNQPCIWALVIPEAPKTQRRFRMVGTGHPHADLNTGKYVGTFFFASLIFHVFELP